MQNCQSSQKLRILYTHFHIRKNCFDILFADGDEHAVWCFLKWNLEPKEKHSFIINASKVLVAMTNYQGPLMTGMQGLSSPDFS
jgi:hypothetical protein